MVPQLLFTNSIGHTVSVPMEVEIPTNIVLSSRISTEGFVIEGIVGLLKLITKAVVCFFEVEAGRCISGTLTEKGM